MLMISISPSKFKDWQAGLKGRPNDFLFVYKKHISTTETNIGL
jgi:hypothetical protein